MKFLIEVNLPEGTDPSEVLDRAIELTGEEDACVTGPLEPETAMKRIRIAPDDAGPHARAALCRYLDTRGPGETLADSLREFLRHLESGRLVYLGVEVTQ